MKSIASRNDEYLVDLVIFCTRDLHVPKISLHTRKYTLYPTNTYA